MVYYTPLTNGSSPHFDMIDWIRDGRADMALCGFWLSSSHQNNADLSVPYEAMTVTMYVPISTLVDDAAAIAYSLSKGVWITFLLSLVVLVIFLMVITKSKLNKNERRKSTVEYILYLVEIATGHSVSYSPRHSSMRFLFIR